MFLYNPFSSPQSQLGDHPNIVKYYAHTLINENECHTMLILCELCTGGTLIDLLERYNYKLAEKQIVFIMRHLLT